MGPETIKIIAEHATYKEILSLAVGIVLISISKTIATELSILIKSVNKRITCILESKRTKQRRHLVHSINIAEKINDLLTEIRIRFDCDRVYLFQYHNSGIFNNGLSFMKATNTFEVVKNGIPAVMYMMKDLPVTMFAIWNKKVISGEVIKHPTIDPLEKSDLATFQTLSFSSTKSIYGCGLFVDKVPIGFIGLDYCTDIVDLSDEMLKELEEYSIRISSFLDARACD